MLYPHRVTVGSPCCVLVWLGPRQPALLLALEQGDRERECCCSFGSIFQVLSFLTYSKPTLLRQGSALCFATRVANGTAGLCNSLSPTAGDSDGNYLQIPASMSGRDREAQAVIDALQDVYRKSLKPIEELSLFDKVCTHIRGRGVHGIRGRWRQWWWWWWWW